MSGVLHRYERSAAAAVPRFYTIVSVFSNEGPPVPIPNTEVKLICADDTWREAAWENRSMLTRLPCRGGGFPSCLLCRTVLYSSLAQSVEHAAVNRGVVGSSPTGGASIKAIRTLFDCFFECVRGGGSEGVIFPVAKMKKPRVFYPRFFIISISPLRAKAKRRLRRGRRGGRGGRSRQGSR